MSESRFTKGEWKFNGNDESITDCTKAENEIAIVNTGDWHDLGMGYANAHLIAAAPEMYKFLDDLANGRGTDYPIEQLLAKARGENTQLANN